MNLGLIIGIVAVVAIVGVAIIFGSKLFLNDKGGTSSSINQNLNGKVKLVKNYTEISTYIDVGDLNKIHFNTGNKVIDIKGNELVNAEYTERKYLGDDYYAVIKENNIVISKDNSEIFRFVTNGDITYNNNTLYYTTIVNNEKFIVAYDLKNKKELWKNRGENPFILENGNIVVKGYDSYGIIDKNGNEIAFGDKNTKVYPTDTNYYFKEINSNLEIYDGKTKINEFSLETKDKVYYEFVSPLSNGMFVISEFSSNTWQTVYKVYDKDLKLITELDDCDSFEGSVLGFSHVLHYNHPLNSATASIISQGIKNETSGETFDVVIFSNGKIEKISYLSAYNFQLDYRLGYLGNDDYNKKHYVIGMDFSEGKEQAKIKLINLSLQTVKINSSGDWNATGIAESPNGKYVVINYNTTYNDSKMKIVLDETFEILYETENQLKIVNDKFVIEYSLKSRDEIYLVNVFTKEKTKLDTTGDYYDNNSVGLITSNNGTYNLYSLN